MRVEGGVTWEGRREGRKEDSDQEVEGKRRREV